MRNKLAQTSNLLGLSKAFKFLTEKGNAEPQIGMIFGHSGHGKTTSVTRGVNDLPQISNFKAIYLRALGVWTVSEMLRSLCDTLGIACKHGNTKNLRAIFDFLELNPTVVFIDEADYLLDGRDRRMLETVRDIYDRTGTPIILVGMEGLQRKIKNSPQFDRRVTQRIEFSPLTLEDTRIVADTCCEIEIADCMVERLHTWSKGVIALVIVALTEIERGGKLHKQEVITSDWWGDRALRRGD
jgi:DNA transposition AAA+ family ATPase